MEILKLIASFLTPLIVLVLGLIINKTIERNKITLLKEKEWQVRWAETFLTRAIKFEEEISLVVASLHRLQSTEQGKDKDEILKTIKQSIGNIQYLDWDIKNFVQFAEKNSKDVMDKQHELMIIIADIIKNSQGDLEKVRKIQFDYNKAVRQAHNEILNAKN